MINRVSSTFSIKDLQNISGIKIPTIRMWEKRYSVFSPQRTHTNIRLYSSEDLQKLMNIVYLQKHGYKISLLSALTASQIAQKVKEYQSSFDNDDDIVNDMMLAMLNFDKILFTHTYAKIAEQYPFKELFLKYLIPFLERIGLLWQTSTINPMHEHFVSNLILQKLYANIDSVSEPYSSYNTSNQLFVLFLPDNEIHEISLLFIYYNLLLKNKKAIYLGENVSINQLKHVLNLSQKIIFVSHFTFAPIQEELDDYFSMFAEKLLSSTNELRVGGYQIEKLNKEVPFSQITVYKDIIDMLEA